MTLNGVLFPAFIVCHVTLALEPEPFVSESFEDSSITPVSYTHLTLTTN